MKAPAQHPAARARSHGFSMVELLVAMVITVVLAAGIGQVFLSTKQSLKLQNTLARLQESGRYAMNVLATDLRRAGYRGGNTDISTITGSLGVYEAATEACIDTPAGPANWIRTLGHSVYGLELSGSSRPSDAGNDYGCIKNAGAAPYLRGDVLLVRYAHPASKPLPCNKSGVNTVISDCYPHDYFLRTSLFMGRLFQGKDSEADENSLAAAGLSTTALVAHAYYIAASGKASACPAEGAVPSLYRITLVNGAFRAEEVAYGVENLQVMYGIDSDADAVINRYYRADGIDSADPGKPDWESVVAVRIGLLARAECPETGYSHSNTYAMTADYTPSDTNGRGYRRKFYTTTVALRNYNQVGDQP